MISQFHPSIVHQSSGISTQELLIMADVLISDYSSLPIEAKVYTKPTLFYVYDETEYHDQRGLNQFYWTIPEVYKVTDEAEIINKLKNDSTQLKPLFESWHDYNSTQSLMLLMNFIDKLVKMKIAVIIPVYNAEKTIRQAVKSIDTTHDVEIYV